MNNAQWAKSTFGQADLGDPRRTTRLVKLVETLAYEPGKPLVSITQSPADMEGAYRFIRNEHVNADAIAKAGYLVTAAQATKHTLTGLRGYHHHHVSPWLRAR